MILYNIVELRNGRLFEKRVSSFIAKSLLSQVIFRCQPPPETKENSALGIMWLIEARRRRASNAKEVALDRHNRDQLNHLI